MLSGIKRLYLIMVGMAFFLVICASIGETLEKSADDFVQLQPDEVVVESDTETSYYFHFEGIKMAGVGIAFKTNHHDVTVYCDKAKVHRVHATDSIWGHTTGMVWSFVHVPYETETVRIRVEQIYDCYEMPPFSIYTGNDRELYCSMLKDSIFAMACSAIIILIGIVSIVIWSVAKKKINSTNNIFYLGIIAITFGMWSFNETDGATILFENRVACSFMAFVLLKLIGPTFVLFAREYTDEKRKVVWSIFSRLIIVESVITLSMHMGNIMDLKETVITTHLLLALCILYGFIITGDAIRKKKLQGQKKVLILEAVVILLAASGSFGHYFTGNPNAAAVGYIGFLAFVAIAASVSSNTVIKMMEKGKYAAIYEELAVTDTLTGLYNRNAYQVDSEKIVDLNGFMILTFDLNDLKKCNDTMGHAAGDHYIITAAAMIESLLTPYGRCYRIGGDEFCSIVRNGTTCPVEELLIKLEMEQVKYNANLSEDGYPIRIAAGYALYDPQTDANMEEMRERADIHMYRNKQKIKEQDVDSKE